MYQNQFYIHHHVEELYYHHYLVCNEQHNDLMSNLMKKKNILINKQNEGMVPVGKAKPASKPFSLINVRFIVSNRSLLNS